MTNNVKHYDVIRSPIITEKATQGTENTRLTFAVAIDATKPEIKAAAEALWDVKVTKVNTLRQEGKVKRFRGIKGKRAETKKAMITFAEGTDLDAIMGG